MRAIAEHIDDTLSRRRSPPLSIEGAPASRWILMDFGDVVVHVFKSDVREHYAIEKLWADAPRVRLPAQKGAPPAGPVAPPARRAARSRNQG